MRSLETLLADMDNEDPDVEFTATVGELRVVVQATNDMLALIKQLVDPGPCRLDHDGNCQEHAWFGDTMCPHRIGQLLTAVLGDA